MKRNIPTNLCPPHFVQRGKKHLLQLTAGFTSGIPTDYFPFDINWYLVSITHLCSACFLFLFFFSCNLWSYCSMHDSVHKTKNRPLYLFYTDCINPNSVAIRPSLYEIFVISFFYGLLSHGHLFHISVFFYWCDPWSVILLIPAWNHF